MTPINAKKRNIKHGVVPNLTEKQDRDNEFTIRHILQRPIVIKPYSEVVKSIARHNEEMMDDETKAILNDPVQK